MLTRGLALLGAYRSTERELSQTELARRTGLPKPTVHRLVAELVEYGALERARAGVRLGQWLYLLGTRAPRISLLRSVSQPYLDRLHELTREHVCLSVHGDEEAVDIAWSGAAPWRTVFGSSYRGTVSPAALRALVAGEDDTGPFLAHTVIERSLNADIPAPRGALARHFRLAGTAAPVSVFGDVVAAISVVGLTDRFDNATNGSHLRSTVGTLARRLALTTVFSDQPAEP